MPALSTMRSTSSAATCKRSSGARAVRPSARRAMVVRAQAQSTANPLSAFLKSVGNDPSEGVFGFKPFAETWVGRWAMLGFASSMVAEFVTGRGTLGQLGLEPSPALFAVLCVLSGAVVVGGTVDTVRKVAGKQLSRADVARYKNFLGLNKENDWMAEAKLMKQRGDFTTPGNDMAAIEASKAAGSPADRFLSLNDRQEGVAAAQELKEANGSVATLTKEQEGTEVAAKQQPSLSLAERRAIEEQIMLQNDVEYAREVEVGQGRLAMVGFLSAVLVEAATGNGILGQLIVYCKMSGLLGAESGF